MSMSTTNNANSSTAIKTKEEALTHMFNHFKMILNQLVSKENCEKYNRTDKNRASQISRTLNHIDNTPSMENYVSLLALIHVTLSTTSFFSSYLNKSLIDTLIQGRLFMKTRYDNSSREYGPPKFPNHQHHKAYYDNSLKSTYFSLESVDLSAFEIFLNRKNLMNRTSHYFECGDYFKTYEVDKSKLILNFLIPKALERLNTPDQTNSFEAEVAYFQNIINKSHADFDFTLSTLRGGFLETQADNNGQISTAEVELPRVTLLGR